jgi:hypothetical protein
MVMMMMMMMKEKEGEIQDDDCLRSGLYSPCPRKISNEGISPFPGNG